MAYGRYPDEAGQTRPFYVKGEDSKLCNCCCCATITLLTLLIVVIGIALLFILVLKPSKPEFELESGSIQSFHVDKQIQGLVNIKVYLSMNITLIFSAKNPNRVAIEYSPTKFQCLYHGTLLGVATVLAFEQPAHSHTAMTATVVVERLNVLQSSSLDLLNDVTVHDQVALAVNGPVDARVRVLGFNSPRVEVPLKCQIVMRPQEREVESKTCDIGQVSLSD